MEFLKFPSTKYLISYNQSSRDKKIFTDYERKLFLKNNLIIEEKMDGSNLGISFNSEPSILIQNRGSYINHCLDSWEGLSNWIKQKENDLFNILGTQYIIFGEWCRNKHSIHYINLPDWFLAFDIYDKEKKYFISSWKRNLICKEIGVYPVPFVKSGVFNIDQLEKLLQTKSTFSNSNKEGLYLRYEDEYRLLNRAKIVNKEFSQSIITHWKNVISDNILNNNKG